MVQDMFAGVMETFRKKKNIFHQNLRSISYNMQKISTHALYGSVQIHVFQA